MMNAAGGLLIHVMKCIAKTGSSLMCGLAVLLDALLLGHGQN